MANWESTAMVSAASIPTLPPVLTAKPTEASQSPPSGIAGSLTTKEWVIPPRPKPGRKPAADTPHTKRKAQNRAAQRAFRERRAARVEELEEQLRRTEEDNEIQIGAFKKRISSLSHEMEQYRNELAWWRDRCHALENEVSQAKEAAMRRAIPDSVPLPPRAPAPGAQRGSNQVYPTGLGRLSTSTETGGHGSGNEKTAVILGCSRCSESHCQCIEEAFAMPIIADNQETFQSKHFTSPDGGKSKRRRTASEAQIEPEEIEIDFTSRFSSTRAQPDASSAKPSSAVDPCGFCQNGTPCICAEMAVQEEQRQQVRQPGHSSPFDSTGGFSKLTPPPSESDHRLDTALPPIRQVASSTCVNGPGTCAQCQADPQSTLFCMTLAASRQSTTTNSSSAVCCGGSGTDGGCCQSRRTTQQSTTTTPPPKLSSSGGAAAPGSGPTNASGSGGLALSCADTFTTLSRHPNFSRATDELSTWVPRLHALPTGVGVGGSAAARPALEVEVASVMSVLHYFDRRFAN